MPVLCSTRPDLHSFQQSQGDHQRVPVAHQITASPKQTAVSELHHGTGITRPDGPADCNRAARTRLGSPFTAVGMDG